MGTYEFDGEKYKKASKHQKDWGNRLISGLELSGDETIQFVRFARLWVKMWAGGGKFDIYYSCLGKVIKNLLIFV